jgi:hypothetical protein
LNKIIGAIMAYGQKTKLRKPEWREGNTRKDLRQ